MVNYLTFASAEPFTIGVNNATKNWDGILEYSTDTAVWTEWDGTTAIASAEHDGEQKIYMRGSGNSVITGTSVDRHWVLEGSNIRCVGNIENLLDYETVASGEHPSMGSYCFYSMFASCHSLITAPALPATILAEHCYDDMFESCNSLTTAPALPATTLAEGCYTGMFGLCTSLTGLPALPATELVNECYTSMFHDCTNIKLSKTQTDEYTTEYRIPISGTGTRSGTPASGMFIRTGGTYTGFYMGYPDINTTLYTANRVIPAVAPEEPSTPFHPDPLSMTMGWQIGKQIAGMRK